MTDFEISEIDEQHLVAVHGEVRPDALPDFFGGAFTTVMEAIGRAGVVPTGPPIGYYPAMPTDVVVVEAGFPTAEPVDAGDGVHTLTLPGGPAVVAEHIGPYDTMEQTYEELGTWMTEQGLTPRSGPWETYLTDPSAEPDPAKWCTRITWPVSTAPTS